MNDKKTDLDIQTNEELINRLEQLKGKMLCDFDIDDFVGQHRGSVGNIVEFLVIGRLPNNSAEPDIPHLGIEIKTSQVIKVKKKFLKAKERLTLNMIDYNEENWLNFYESSYYKKNKNILLVLLKSTNESDDYDKDNLKIEDYMFIDITSKGFENDLKVIKDDFATIGAKVLNGEAHLLSEGDTLFLGAATKAANSSKRTTQPFSIVEAKPRAFTYKQSYVSSLIAQKLSGSRQYELLASYLGTNLSLEQILINKIIEYKGYSKEELFRKFGSSPTQLNPDSKSILPTIIKRIISESNNDNISELIKADIKIKTIRIRSNKIKESMSFPRFKFDDVLHQDFNDSDIYQMLSQQRFLFVIFNYDKTRDDYLLDDVMFWNMPFDDLEKCEEVFNQAKSIIKTSTHSFTAAKNNIMHVRPHGRNKNDVDFFPDKTKYTKQCFWLYNHYILGQIKHLLKNP